MISYRGGNIQRLYARESLIFQEKSWTPVLKIERIENQGVVLRHIKKDQKKFLPFGNELPGVPSLTLVEGVALTELHYEFKVVDQQPNQEPILEHIEGSRAYLVKEVLNESLSHNRQTFPPTSVPSARPSPSPGDLITKVKVTQVAEDTYDIDKESLTPLYKSLRRGLQNPKENLGLTFSVVSPSRFELKTSFGDAAISREGFILTRFDEAQKLGLQVGDRIISINEQSVNSPLMAWGTAASIVLDHPEITHRQFTLEREGRQLTKTLSPGFYHLPV